MPRLQEAVWALLHEPAVKENVRMDRISCGADGQGCVTPASSSAGIGRGSQDTRGMDAFRVNVYLGDGELRVLSSWFLLGDVIHAFVSAAEEAQGPVALRCACVRAAKQDNRRRNSPRKSSEIAYVTFLPSSISPGQERLPGPRRLTSSLEKKAAQVQAQLYRAHPKGPFLTCRGLQT